MIDPIKQSGLDASNAQSHTTGLGNTTDIFDPEGLLEAVMNGKLPFQQELPLDEFPLSPMPEEVAFEQNSEGMSSQGVQDAHGFAEHRKHDPQEPSQTATWERDSSEGPSEARQDERESLQAAEEAPENPHERQPEESRKPRDEEQRESMIGLKRRSSRLAARGSSKRRMMRSFTSGERESMSGKQEAKSAMMARLLGASQLATEGQERMQLDGEPNVQLQSERHANATKTDKQIGKAARRPTAAANEGRGRHGQERDGKARAEESNTTRQSARIERQNREGVQNEASMDSRQIRADLANAVSRQSTRDLARFGRQTNRSVNGQNDTLQADSGKVKNHHRKAAAQAQSGQQEQASTKQDQGSNQQGSAKTTDSSSPQGASGSTGSNGSSGINPVVGSYTQAVNQSAVSQASNGAAGQNGNAGQTMKGNGNGLAFVDSSGGDDAVIRLSDTEAGKLEVRLRRDGDNLSLRLKAEDPNQRQQMLDGMSELRRELAKSDLVEGRVDVAEFSDRDDNYDARDSRSERQKTEKSDGAVDTGRAETNEQQDTTEQEESAPNSENRLHLIA